MSWHVYMIQCSDGSLYTGITTDPLRRFRQHADGQGAKYFRARQPLRMVYLESGHTRSTAGKRELQIKHLNHADKCILVSRNEKGVVLNLDPGSCPTKLIGSSREVKHVQQ